NRKEYHMARMRTIELGQATGKAKDLLEAVHGKLGVTPNMMKAMANSPAVLEAYVAMSGALAKASLSGKLREQIALTVGEADGCEDCAAAHTLLGKKAGLSDAEAVASRQATAGDAKTDAALKFAAALVEKRGTVSDGDFERVRGAGFGDGEIAEIVASVSLDIFTNYFNVANQTDLDFPPAPK